MQTVLYRKNRFQLMSLIRGITQGLLKSHESKHSFIRFNIDF